jgi:iron(III) transport system permease protein
LEDFGVERLPSIYGFWGAWLALTLFAYPYVFLSVRAGLRGMNPALEEASYTLGKSGMETFRQIILPQLRPFITAGALLVALYTLSDFGAVSIMQYNVFTRAIYLRLGVDLNLAALLSLVLVFFTAIIMVLTALMEGRGRYYTQNVRRVQKRLRLGRWQIVAQLFCAVIVLLALVAPLGVMGYWLINGLRHGEELRDVFAPLQRSMRASALAAAGCAVIALPFVFLQVRYPTRLSRIVAGSAYLGYALPGVVVALALVFFGARYLHDLNRWLGLDSYRTLPLLVFAYVVRFLPQALGPARAGLMQVNPQLEESGLTLGRSRLRVFWDITLPLMRSGLLAGTALVFLTAMKELPATLLLAPIGYDTLATRIWSASSEAFYARAAAPALVLVLISALSLVFILESDD